jgi:hypothetical protein
MACYIFKSQQFTKLSTDIVESILSLTELFKSQLLNLLIFTKKRIKRWDFYVSQSSAIPHYLA